MKARLLALVVITALPLVGFDCIVSPFTVSINLDPLNGTYPIKPGATKYADSVIVNPGSLYNTSYELTGASVYDIKVSTSGRSNLGPCSGTIFVNGDTLLTFKGNWTDFSTPQSLLTSALMTRNAAGVTQLVNAVLSSQPVKLRAVGAVTNPLAGLNTDFVTVSAYVQAYGQLK
jgi:hypothetical protein